MGCNQTTQKDIAEADKERDRLPTAPATPEQVHRNATVLSPSKEIGQGNK